MAGRTIVVASDAMGEGDVELGRVLAASFFRNVATARRLPDAVAFYNTGVRLLEPASPAAEAIARLADAGVDVLACGTCVARLQLDRETLVGRVSNMQEIADLLLDSDHVIRI